VFYFQKILFEQRFKRDYNAHVDQAKQDGNSLHLFNRMYPRDTRAKLCESLVIHWDFLAVSSSNFSGFLCSKWSWKDSLSIRPFGREKEGRKKTKEKSFLLLTPLQSLFPPLESLILRLLEGRRLIPWQEIP